MTTTLKTGRELGLPYQLTSEFLPQLLDNNQRFVEYQLERMPAVDVPKFVRDYGTIRLSIGRRSGHTGAVFALASHDDLVVVSSAYEAQCVLGETAATVVHLDALLEPAAQFNFRRIFFAQVEHLSPEKLDKIYQLITGADQQVVFVGC